MMASMSSRNAGFALVTAAATFIGADIASAQETMTGIWNATLKLDQRDVSFTLEIPEKGPHRATITQDSVRMATASVGGNDEELILDFPLHESQIRAARADGALYGEWKRERLIEGQPVTERVPFEAHRLPSGGGCMGEVSDQAPLPTRWTSEADDCGSAANFSIRCDRHGHVVTRTTGPDGRVVQYTGMWNEQLTALSLDRFDGVEAQAIHATRLPDGSFAGQVWTGPSMPTPWVIRPVAPTSPTAPP